MRQAYSKATAKLRILVRGTQYVFKKNHFTTIHNRPKWAKDALRSDTPLKRTVRYAIVIQGPLVLENAFTEETVRLYRKNHPRSTVIISTWKEEDPKTIQKIRALGGIVLENEKPATTGVSHINYQIHSTREGIREAKKQRCTHVLKTRSDQRLYATDIGEKLVALLRTYPIQKQKQKSRIIVAGFGTAKYRPYMAADLFQFGTIQDIELYWNAPYDTRALTTPTTDATQENPHCEAYLMTSFLSRTGWNVQHSLIDSWNAFGELFCVIDDEIIDPYWRKYEHYLERRTSAYGPLHQKERMDFGFWILLQQKNVELQLEEKRYRLSQRKH